MTPTSRKRPRVTNVKTALRSHPEGACCCKPSLLGGHPSLCVSSPGADLVNDPHSTPRTPTPRSQHTKNGYHTCKRQSKWAVSSYVYTAVPHVTVIANWFQPHSGAEQKCRIYRKSGCMCTGACGVDLGPETGVTTVGISHIAPLAQNIQSGSWGGGGHRSLPDGDALPGAISHSWVD